MKNNYIKFIKSIELHDVVNFEVCENYYVSRLSRSLVFISKENNSKIEFQIELDNELGLKRMVSFKDVVIIVVHSKKDSKNELFGDPSYVELRAYSIEGLLWSHHLKEWNLSVNFGGFHLSNNFLIFFEKLNDEIYMKKMNPVNGEEMYTEKSLEFKDIHTTETNYEKYVNIHNQLFLLHKNNWIKITQKNNEFQFETIFDKDVFMMCANSNHILGLYLDETYKAVFYNLSSKKISDEINLKSGFDIKSITINKDSSKLIVTSNSHSNIIACFDLIKEKYIWKIELDDFKDPLELYIDDMDRLYVQFFNIEIEFQIFNLNDGTELFKLSTDFEVLNMPFFINNDMLYIKHGGFLKQYEILK